MLCILRLGNQVGSYFGPNFGCYGSLLAKIGVPILPKLVPVCQVGCPTSRSNYDPNRIQTISDHHISNPSGGHLWPKLVHFGHPRTTNGGALFPIFLRTIDIQCWTRFCKKLAIFGNFFYNFWALLVILKLQHWPPANCYALCQSNWESFLGQLHTKLVLTIWLGHPATHSIPDMGYYKSVI